MAKNIVLGADPEFCLVDEDGHATDAEEVIRDAYNEDEFGVDGSGTPVELRPGPSSNPLKVVHSIYEALQKGLRRYPDLSEYTWKAGSCVDEAPIGGHIHFSGLPFRIDEEVADNLEAYQENDICEDDWTRGQLTQFKRLDEFSTALDTYLAQVVLLIEQPGEAKERRGDYGALSDIRVQDWGLEYRVVGSWVTSPAIAAGVLCLAKVVAHEAAFNGLRIRNDIKPVPCHFREANYTVHKKKFKRLWSRIRKMELYPKYKKYINFLRRLITSRRNWLPKNNDMKAAWGIYPSK